MYNDYPAVYESIIDQSLIYLIILAIIIVIILTITLISVSKVFKKANRSGISAIIPFYNIWILLEIVNLPKIYFILMLIPIVNIFAYIKISFILAKLFRKSKMFALGLIVLPFIFYPVLAFSGSEYIGINIVAMEGKSTVVDIPTVVEEDNKKLTVNEEVDEKSQKLNISIGGGVYQKDYTKDLLSVDNNQAIYKAQSDNENQKSFAENISQPQNTFVTQIKEEIVKEEPKDINTEFQSQIYNVKPIEMVVTESNLISPENINTSENVNSISHDSNVNQLTEKLFGEPEKIVEPTINIQSTTNESIKQNSEFITCPKCGATVKSNAKACFLCGTHLE